MADEKEWFIDQNFKDNDFLTFNCNRIEHSYKYKNFKTILKRELKEVFRINLSQKIQDSRNGSLSILNISETTWVEGINCEIIQDGVEKKGKIRLVVSAEFIPDEVEVIQGVEGITDERSPLDDIRQINL